MLSGGTRAPWRNGLGLGKGQCLPFTAFMPAVSNPLYSAFSHNLNTFILAVQATDWFYSEPPFWASSKIMIEEKTTRPLPSQARKQCLTFPLSVRMPEEVKTGVVSGSLQVKGLTASGSDERHPLPLVPTCLSVSDTPPCHTSVPSHLPFFSYCSTGPTYSLVAVYWSMVWYKVISDIQNFAQIESQALQRFSFFLKKRTGDRMGGNPT